MGLEAAIIRRPRNRALVNFFKSIESLTDLNNIPKPAKRSWETACAGDKLPNSGNPLELQVPNLL